MAKNNFISEQGERESLRECLRILYGITVQMQLACQGLEERMPNPQWPRETIDAAFRGFSIIFDACQQQLEEASGCMAAELKNIRIPQAPTLN